MSELPFSEAEALEGVRGAGSWRTEQKEKTRARIIRAARGCFLTKGVGATSFDDIAQRAGVARATVYLHFNCKEALLLAMLRDDWAAQRALFASLRFGADGVPDFAQWLRRMIAAFRARRESLGLYALIVGQDPGTARELAAQRLALLATLGVQFPAFDIAGWAEPDRRVRAYLMLIQIEQFCMMATNPDWADTVEAGIAHLERALIEFVAPQPSPKEP